MSNFTKEKINDLANKLLFELNEEENNLVLSEFDEIDKSIKKLENISGLEEAKEMTHCLDVKLETLREDTYQESIDTDLLLRNSDNTEGNEIIVPKVVS